MTYEMFLGTLGLLIAAVTAFLGLRQLQQLVAQVKIAVKANSLSQLSALLQIEQHITNTRKVFADAGLKMASHRGKENTQEFEHAKLEYDEAKQMHLNALDRLCSTIIKGLLDEDQLRPEYRDNISDLVKQYPADFDTATPYRNIKKLYQKWADS